MLDEYERRVHEAREEQEAEGRLRSCAGRETDSVEDLEASLRGLGESRPWKRRPPRAEESWEGAGPSSETWSGSRTACHGSPSGVSGEGGPFGWASSPAWS